jgi:hypothetical protein
MCEKVKMAAIAAAVKDHVILLACFVWVVERVH